MIEDNSEDVLQKKQVLEYQSTRKASKNVPFNKQSCVTFVKVGNCHMCKNRNKVVYQCYRNYLATSCQKKFCLDCLVLIYKQNIIQHLQKNDSWKCPYLKKICRCKNCCGLRKQTYSILQLDTNLSVYANLKSKVKNQEEQDENEIDQNMKCLLKQKFKKLIEMNGQLISKVNTHYHKLSQEEIKFYNKLIHANLKVLNSISQNMVTHQTFVEE